MFYSDFQEKNQHKVRLLRVISKTLAVPELYKWFQLHKNEQDILEYFNYI